MNLPLLLIALCALGFAAPLFAEALPDFSTCGYLNTGENDLPDNNLPTLTQASVSGDDQGVIQAAIDTVSAWPMDSDGYRGVVYLPSSDYSISSPIFLTTSGVIIRGSGRESTTVNAAYSGTRQEAFQFLGSSDPVGTGNTYSLTATTEPGDNVVSVSSGHNFVAGDTVWLITTPTTEWTDLLGTTDAWDSSELPELERKYKRTVVSVSASEIELDVDIVDPTDFTYVLGALQKYSWNGKIEKVGISDMTIESSYTSATDESHAWTGVYFDKVQDGFVARVDGKHFTYATVYCDEQAYRITVIDSTYREPIGEVSASRRYAFTTRGQLCFFRRCSTEDARHAFTANTGSAGPNAFVECVSVDDTAATGPYHRWNPGVLFDLCESDDQITTQNRIPTSSRPLGRWTGASIVFSNCIAPTIIMGTPPGLHNWAYGCIETSGDGQIDTEGSAGTTTIVSTGTPVTFENGFDSLYDEQYFLRTSLCNESVTCYDDLVQGAGFTPEEGLFDADPLDRGIPNGLAYGLGFSLTGTLTAEEIAQLPRITEASTEGSMAMIMVLPESSPPDVTYYVFESTTIEDDPDDWAEVARKEGSGAWTGTATISESSFDEYVEVHVEFSGTDPSQSRSFMRLGVTLEE